MARLISLLLVSINQAWDGEQNEENLSPRAALEEKSVSQCLLNNQHVITDQAADVWGFINKVAEQEMGWDSNLQQLLVGKRQDALEDDNVGPVHRFLWRGTGKKGIYVRKKNV